jgi:hypothetical protein
MFRRDQMVAFSQREPQAQARRHGS